MSEENVEVVQRAFAVFADAQPDEFTDRALGEFADPEIEWVPVPQGVLGGNSYVGFEGVRRFWADFDSAWDEIRYEPQELRRRKIVLLRSSG